MDQGMYETDGKGGLVKISSEGKNDLLPGQVLRWGGNVAAPEEEFVISEALELDTKYSGGRNYRTISLEDYRYYQTDAASIKLPTDAVWHGQHMFLQERTLTAEELEDVRTKAEAKRKNDEAAQAAKAKLRDQQLAEGRRLFEEYIPKAAKALIVAFHEVDDCDTMTDYFATHTDECVVLGWSKHTRDLFPEMRKVADRIPETAHLATAPAVDENGHERTEDNKKWWHPSDEHREKYSMGAGYYLKATSRYSTGWKIEEDVMWGNDWDDRIYIGLAKRCIFGKAEDTGQTQDQVDGVTVSINEEKNGVEIRFPARPPAEILNTLKDNGWRWSRFNGCWYNQQSDTNIQFANIFTD